jgi:hypothetical protein
MAMLYRSIVQLAALMLVDLALLAPSAPLSAAEPDDTLPTATSIALPFTIDTAITADDVDFYVFSARRGDIINIDIDAPAGSSLDSMVAVFDAAGAPVPGGFSDDNPAPGESSTLDSFLGFRAPYTGVFYAGVTSFADFGFDGGPDHGTAGNYRLSVRVAHFTGGAQGVGSVGQGAVTITGAFTLDEPLDLSAAGAQATIVRLLDEGGVELVAGAPFTLTADSRNSTRAATYSSPAGALPAVRLTLGARAGGTRYTFRLEVSGATITVPASCLLPPVPLTLEFAIDDLGNPPVGIEAPLDWVCYGSANQYLKTTP